MKDLLQSIPPHLWREEFEFYVDRFINKRLREEEMATEAPEIDYNNLYGDWWLVPSKNWSWCNNISRLLHPQRSMAPLYGKVKGM